MNISDFPAPHIPKKLPITEIVKTILSDYAFLKVNFEAAARLSEFIGLGICKICRIRISLCQH